MNTNECFFWDTLYIVTYCSKEAATSDVRGVTMGGLGVGGLSLRSVTASVGKQIGALSGLHEVSRGQPLNIR